MKDLCCPLCKRRLPEISSGDLPESKLCEQCQSMVHTALRGEAVSSPPLAARRPFLSGQIEPGVATLEVELPEYSAESDSLFEGQLPSTVEPANDALADAAEDDIFHFPTDAHLDAGTTSLQSYGSPSLMTDDPVYETSEHSTMPGDADQEPETGDHLAADSPAIEFKQSVVGLRDVSSDDLENAYFERAEAFDDQPAPSWEYTGNQWPVLLGPNQQAASTRPRILYAAIALVAVGAAACSYLIFRPSRPPQRAALVAASTAPETAPVAEQQQASATPDAAARIESQRSEAVTASAPSAAVNQPASNTTANTTANATGRFALQAAAFPTPEGADEFAERLRRAGVPSYVVAADIGKRGRWYRVRVGRFNSAEEAGRFAAEAQMRGKAAGLALQLIGCPYEQP